jgi:hypothetical protein
MKNPLKKELKHKNELKFYQLSIESKKFVLKNLSELDFIAFSIILDKNKEENRKLIDEYHKNEVYIKLIIELIKLINPNKPFDFKMDNYLLKKYKYKLKKRIT